MANNEGSAGTSEGPRTRSGSMALGLGRVIVWGSGVEVDEGGIVVCRSTLPGLLVLKAADSFIGFRGLSI